MAKLLIADWEKMDLAQKQSAFDGMTKEERKGLAAQRSLQRSKAQKAGQPVPPTIAEDLGKEAKEFKPRGSGEGKARAVKGVAKEGEVLAAAGEVAKLPRKINDRYHISGGAIDDEIMSRAIDEGFPIMKTYTVGKRVAGHVFFESELDFAEKESAITAVLVGTKEDTIRWKPSQVMSKPGREMFAVDETEVGTIGAEELADTAAMVQQEQTETSATPEI